MAGACKHEHLKFMDFGQKISCLDCTRRWLAADNSHDVRDYMYLNPDLENETRHSLFAAPKNRPV